MSSIEAEAFEPQDFDGEQREHYKIGGKSEADWALRKRRKALESIAENKALFQQELDRLVEWQDKVNKPHEDDVTYFSAILRNWHQGQLEADPEDAAAWKKEPNKSIPLPAGTLAMAKNPASIEVDDDEFVPWALANQPDLVKVERVVTRKPIKAEIKKLLVDGKVVDPETGEKIPGVTVNPAEVRWTVES